MKRRSMLASLSILTMLVLPCCGMAGERLPDYRYRLTIEVETPEGLKTGSSVIEVSTTVAGENALPTPRVVGHRLRGEAVAVDLGARGTLFALLRSEDNSDWASGVMFDLTPSPAGVEVDKKFAARFAAMLKRRHPVELQGRLRSSRYIEGGLARPILIRFRDIADPKTVEKVDPEDLAASFGKGVLLRRITVQMTSEPVTTGIEKRLRWVGKYPEPSLNPQHGMNDYSIAATTHHGDFLRTSGK